MFSEEELRFIEYWEANRLRRKRFFRQLAIGLPVGVLFVMAIFVSFFSGWHRQAAIEIRSQSHSQPDYSTIILVLILAGLLILGFSAGFFSEDLCEMN